MSDPQALHADSADAPARVLRLQRGEERRLAAGHVWVFSNEIDTGSTPLTAFAPGAVAQVRTQRDAFVGYACVNPHALICARILSRDEARPVDGVLIERRLRTALALRERLTGAPYYRWVFGESDQLPGLVLDRYGAVVVGQIATAGMEALREEVAAAVRAVLAPAVLYWKNDSAARELEHLPRFTALAFAQLNAARNGTAVQVLRADAFEALKSLTEQGERFDLVILDPPAFIKRKKDTPKGQAAYRKLNQLALGLLADEGLLVSCSCSYHLAPEELVSAIQSAARHSGRFVQILEAGGQSPDHPVHPAIPETRYLKAFFCRVTREVG